MRPPIAYRAAALAAVALVAAAGALAVRGGGKSKTSTLPPGAGPWYSVLAAPYQPKAGKRGLCGVRIGPKTIGVAHPTLPCGIKIYIEYGGKEVLAQVVDRGPPVAGRAFDLTPALAQELGVHGTQTVRWRYVR
jgi:rare lipoprotein A (peptidoglycan hydrolase)